MLVDQSTDTNGQAIHRLSKLHSLPEFVKSASANSLFSNNSMLPKQYAHPAKRLFPCHTKAATWMSYAFFLEQADELSDEAEREFVEDRFDKFAKYHGLTYEINKAKEDHNALSKAGGKIADEDYALTITLPNGSTQSHYPLRNAVEVKTAAEYLRKHQHSFRFSDRQVIAEKVLKKAAEFGEDLGDLSDFLEKTAGRGVCSAEDAAKLIWERISVLDRAPNRDPDLLVQLTKTAMTVLDKGDKSMDKEGRIALAEIVDHLDEQANLKQYYGGVLSTPENVLFAITKSATTKFASEVSQLTSGSVYKLADMEQVPLTDVRDLFGDDFAESISKDGVYIDATKAAEVMPTLPRPEAEQIDRLFEHHGVKACIKQANAATPYGPSEEELKLWANAYLESQTA